MEEKGAFSALSDKSRARGPVRQEFELPMFLRLAPKIFRCFAIKSSAVRCTVFNKAPPLVTLLRESRSAAQKSLNFTENNDKNRFFERMI